MNRLKGCMKLTNWYILIYDSVSKTLMMRRRRKKKKKEDEEEDDGNDNDLVVCVCGQLHCF